MASRDIVVGIGGAAGDGVASAGRTLARAAARQGVPLFGHNSYQSVIRGGHSYLRLRLRESQPFTQGDGVRILVAFNQDSLDRHLKELPADGVALYNGDKIEPSYDPPDGVLLCPMSVEELSPASKDIPIVQNTVAAGAVFSLIGLSLTALESVLKDTFGEKSKLREINLDAARSEFEFAEDQFEFEPVFGKDERKNKLAVVTGNDLIAMGAALSGCKFYAAYPMSPATHILEWFAKHSRDLNICARQVEDEISVINTAIGAAHMGVRSMCATSGGGFSLMTEAIGFAAIMETPIVVVNVQRAGPSTGVPTKTEQGDLNQALGASQGDFPRIILAPAKVGECHRISGLAHNISEQYQNPVILLGDLVLCENLTTIDPSELDEDLPIERGCAVTKPSSENGDAPYLRYKNTKPGVSPRVLPGTPNHMYVSASDEHDEDGVLLSDVFTDTVRRKKMVDKRARKLEDALAHLPEPTLEGSKEAEVALVGWGSTWGVLHEAMELLEKQEIAVKHIHVRTLLPFHSEKFAALLKGSKKIIVVENNQSGQFARHLRAEAGIDANGQIRKYDGEPFEPAQVVQGVKAILDGEMLVIAHNTEPGWQVNHPSGTTGEWAGMIAEGAVDAH